MNITLVEPFFTGSHAAWAEGYARSSRHHIETLSLSGHHWKWRMHGGAVTLARKFMQSTVQPDLLLATDMLDLATFLALTRSKTASVPVAVYFHENQVCYPLSPKDQDTAHQRDHHYGFINFTSALAADKVLFNSRYHFNAFLGSLPRFLKQFPTPNESGTLETVRKKSQVLSLGMDLQKFDPLKHREKKGTDLDPAPLILWNHRWEYDKNPDEFFQALFVLDASELDFRVALLGENSHHGYAIFDAARRKLGDKIVHFGYVKNFEDYARWLYRSDILPVTSNQDFFGASIVEAVYCGCYPLLPMRLSYPELVPQDLYPEIFYGDFEQLVDKLATAIKGIDAVRQQTFRQCLEQYDWGHMAATYDDCFIRLIHSKGR